MEIKPFLAIDRTENDNNIYLNGKEFIVYDVSQETLNEWTAWYKTKTELDKKLRLPQILMYLPHIFLVLGFILTLELLSFAIGKKDISNQTSFIIILICAVVSYSLFILLPRIYNLRGKKLVEKEEYKNCVKKRAELERQSRKELNIPDDYVFTDVISFQYKLIDNKITPISQHKNLSPYMNVDYFFHKDNNNLYVSDASDSFAIPLDAMQKIRKVEMPIKTLNWTKSVSYADPMYRKYIESADGKHITFTHYYILEFSHNGTLWGLYFPPYELPVFEKLTGLTAE